MSKDPAFLFYSSDFLTGTFTMTDEQVGKYVRLLCLQHQRGHLQDNHMVSVCRTYDEAIYSKFKQDSDGKYYNERLEEEIDKRTKYTESRRTNGSNGGRPPKPYVNHMESIAKPYDNHTENENIDDNIDSIRGGVGGEREFHYREIIEHLNVKAGTQYKYTSAKTQEIIKARFHDNFTLEDFYKVIDNKVTDWKNTNYQKYLRPETLFSNKFEGYLNQLITNEIQQPELKQVGRNAFQL